VRDQKFAVGTGNLAPIFSNHFTMRMFSIAALIVAACLVGTPVNAQREKFSPDDIDFIYRKWPDARRTNTGIRYIIERAGHGQYPRPGDLVSVIYVGMLLNGTVFDKLQDPAHPFQFRVARHFVIDGWDQVLQLMRPGEKRLVIIPPELAYGSRGQAPRIPRDASLVFEIELLKVDREQ